ncbi:hypothetical protein MELA_02346 [Candidatus Methylomirabilis lanthanidiphila]|uniref:Uncharacterized protein n=1 Tax=Candidatus Methylomirabilis lanthanidiphila TaxID=2211376 RepID=A0A564ZMS8_9BACT|nr:hypothetical protein [Candidatus Methylomirabilis lanthanidiphila]VUZ85952.1 hypothetical protein MELA_02346 [Candidatus Methylomirabilis lanthanidiphila]
MVSGDKIIGVMRMRVVEIRLAVILCAAMLVIGWAANGEGQDPKGKEPSAAEALAEIRDLINQLNALGVHPNMGTSTTTTTSTMIPGAKPSGPQPSIGSTAQKLLEKIYGLVPYIETDEFRVKEIRWTVGWNTNMEVTMERRPNVGKRGVGVKER